MRSFFDCLAFTLFAILATAAFTLALPLTIARAGWRLFAVFTLLACGSAVYADGCGLAVVRSRVVVAPTFQVPVFAAPVSYAVPTFAPVVQAAPVVYQAAPVIVQAAPVVYAAPVCAAPVFQAAYAVAAVQRVVVQRQVIQRQVIQRQVIRQRSVIRTY